MGGRDGEGRDGEAGDYRRAYREIADRSALGRRLEQAKGLTEEEKATIHSLLVTLLHGGLEILDLAKSRQEMEVLASGMVGFLHEVSRLMREEPRKAFRDGVGVMLEEKVGVLKSKLN